jgi:hypothetical protein
MARVLSIVVADVAEMKHSHFVIMPRCLARRIKVLTFI